MVIIPDSKNTQPAVIEAAGCRVVKGGFLRIRPGPMRHHAEPICSCESGGSLQNEKRAGDGNRTHVTSLEGWSSTIELHPQRKWSGRRDSDPRHPPWQGGTLPTELLPRKNNRETVRTKRLELLRLSAPDPKSGASAIPPRPQNRPGENRRK